MIRAGYSNVNESIWNSSKVDKVVADSQSSDNPLNKIPAKYMKDVVKYKYSVVLLHDSSDKDSTVEALEIMLQRLEEMNAKILPITEESPVIHHTIKAQ